MMYFSVGYGREGSDQWNKSKEKAPTMKGTKAKKKKKKQGIVSPSSSEGKTRRKLAATTRAGAGNEYNGVAEKEKNRKGSQTTFHTELVSSTPQGRAESKKGQSSGLVHHQQEAGSRTTQEQVNPIIKTRQTSGDHHMQRDDVCRDQYQGHATPRLIRGYSASDGYNHGLYVGQMIPERETDRPENTRGQESCHEGRRELPGHDGDGRRFIQEGVALGYGQGVFTRMNPPGSLNIHPEGLDPATTSGHHQHGVPRPLPYQGASAEMNHPRTNGVPSWGLFPTDSGNDQQDLLRKLPLRGGTSSNNGGKTNNIHLSDPTTATYGGMEGRSGQLPWQYTMPPTVDADTAKHVLRDLVNTLKYMNEKGAATMDAKLKEDLVNKATLGDIRLVGGELEDPVPSNLVTRVREAEMDHLPERLVEPNIVQSGDTGMMGMNERFRTGERSKNEETGGIHTASELPLEQANARGCPRVGQVSNKENETDPDSVRKVQEFPSRETEKGERRSAVVGVPMQSDRSDDVNRGEKSPFVKKKKKKVSDRSSSRGRGEKDKRPLWEQQRVLKYLVMELKTATERKENLEVERFFEDILHTLEELPMLTMDRDMRTEIAMALQPLRSENAGLRRKLRIANHQVKAMQQQTEGKPGWNQPSFEVITLQTLNMTLQQQLSTQQEESGALRTKVEGLQRELTAYEQRCAGMERASTLKDESHLQSQGDWMAEMASLRKKLTGSKQEVESFQWKLGSLKRENDFLRKSLEESKASLGRAEETNQRLENVITRLASRPSTESSSGAQRTGADLCSSDVLTPKGSPQTSWGLRSTDVLTSKGPQHSTWNQSRTKTSSKRKRDWDYTEYDYSGRKVTRDKATHMPSLAGSQGCPKFPSSITHPDMGVASSLPDKSGHPGRLHSGTAVTSNGDRTSHSILERSLEDMLNRSAGLRVAFQASLLDGTDNVAARGVLNSKGPVLSDPNQLVEKAQEYRISDHHFDRRSIVTTGDRTPVQDVSGKRQEIRSVSNDCLSRTLPSWGVNHLIEAEEPNSSVLGGSQRLGALRRGEENHSYAMSHASDSTASTITSLFEAQFQLGLNDLDEKIAQLQSNLMSMKK